MFGKGGWTHDDIDQMPIYWRKWDHARLVKQIEEERQAAAMAAEAARNPRR